MPTKKLARETNRKRPSSRSARREPPVLGTRGERKPVKPLPGRPAIGRRYDPGFREPRERNPWKDDGGPEPNG